MPLKNSVMIITVMIQGLPSVCGVRVQSPKSIVHGYPVSLGVEFRVHSAGVQGLLGIWGGACSYMWSTFSFSLTIYLQVAGCVVMSPPSVYDL